MGDQKVVKMISRLIVSTLSFFLFYGCNTPAPLALAPGTFAMRIVANESDHGELVALAKDTPGVIVSDAGEVVAEWLPVAENSRASQQLMKADQFITRERNGRPELLVVHGDCDLTEKHVKQAYFRGFTDPDGHPCVHVLATEEGSKFLRRLTRRNSPDKANNLTRHAAMVLRGQVYAVPKIESVISTQFIISTTSAKQATHLASILNGTDQPPPD